MSYSIQGIEALQAQYIADREKGLLSTEQLNRLMYRLDRIASRMER